MRFIQVKTRKEAKKEAIDTDIIKKVEGGYMIFDDWTEYTTWRNQNDDGKR